MNNSHKRSGAGSAFSLIELLVVIAIIGIITAFTIPAATTLIRGSQLTQGSQLLADQISLARQLALSKNRAVEVRFYRYGDSEIPGEDPDSPEAGKFRAFQLFEITESGGATPVNKMQRLPNAVVIRDGEYSSILSGTGQDPKKAADADVALPSNINRKYEYIAFRFLQDGSTNLSPTGGESGGNWFVTLVNAIDEKKDIKEINFFTLQIDPVSGTSKIYRPNAG
ncbi:MAG: Verru_Chthon cassette protein D [Verrucomicrobiota bacterium]|nr:Verru_Chthon cassette protein D [Verrucomicrobiota bacterium]